MEKENLTIWQRLSRNFGPHGLLNQEYPTYEFDKKELLRTQNKQEYEREKLQAQQSRYLSNQWTKIENNMYTQAVYYEPTRLASVYDFESMEFTPEISTALDIYAEESTTTDENGEILQIYSESPRIRSILKELFVNVLDINTNLPMWTRNTAKYGDNFVYLKLDPERGIVGCQQLPNIEIQRLEPGSSNVNSPYIEQSEPAKSLIFKWTVKNMEFQSWEIAHFRLMGDDRKLPYGTSMLEKARRTWRQLLLAEDAMLIYRISRAPERRVFKVFVGNMDDNDVEPYVNRVANKFKREQIADSKTGNVDLRYNQMAVDQDYFIPVRDPASPSPIETLPGAANLGEIADIEYIQRKLVTALRIPKAFLGFEEAVADGKTLALQDIRFARTINRIQKSMLQELNKIAIIHLFLMGFEDELTNFTLTLNNPSTQSDLLKIDIWKEKIQLYKEAVADPGSGIQPVSATWAKKHIFNFSDEEIRVDLQQQRIERAVGEELKATPLVIKKTGIFEKLDSLYGGLSGETPTQQTGVAPMGEMPPPMGGETFTPPPMEPLAGEAPAGEALAGEAPPPEQTAQMENLKKNLNLLVESNMIKGSQYVDLSQGQILLKNIENELNKILDK